MSENDGFVPPVDPQHIPSEQELQAKLEAKLSAFSSGSGEQSFHPPRTGLAESIAKKKQDEEKRMKKIFESKEAIPTLVKPLLEAEHTYTRHVMPPTVSPNPVKLPEIPAVNKEHEPRELNWVPISNELLITIETISDVQQILAAAQQQRNVAFGLVSPKRGTACFLKVDTSGTLLMAKPEEDPKAWSNVGLNYDNDVDDDNKESTAKDYVPNTRTTSGWPYLDREAHALESEDETANLLEALDVEGLTNPHQRALVAKLLDAAAELRKKEPIIQDDKEELPIKKEPSNTLVEEKNVQENSIDLNQLSYLAMEISKLRKQGDSEQLEAIEDDLLNFIAESLLLGISEVDGFILEEYVERVNNCLEED